MDKDLEKRGHAFVRYGDDLNVYVRTKRSGERVMQSLRRLYARLRLQVNEFKSAVARATERKFLGFSYWISPGREVKRRVAAEALGRMKDRIRELTRPTAGRSLAQVCERIHGYLLGWKGTSNSRKRRRSFANWTNGSATGSDRCNFGSGSEVGSSTASFVPVV